MSKTLESNLSVATVVENAQYMTKQYHTPTYAWDVTLV